MTNPTSPNNPPPQYPIAPTTPPPPTTSTPPAQTSSVPNTYQAFASGAKTPSSSSSTPPAPDAPVKGAVGDPTGMWQKWLSSGGVQATPQEVQMFLSTLIKFMAQSVIGEANKKAHESYLRMKAVIEGRDPTDI